MEVRSGRGVVVLAAADGDAHGEPAGGEAVDGGQLLGQQRAVSAERCDEDGGGQPRTAADGRRRGQRRSGLVVAVNHAVDGAQAAEARGAASPSRAQVNTSAPVAVGMVEGRPTPISTARTYSPRRLVPQQDTWSARTPQAGESTTAVYRSSQRPRPPDWVSNAPCRRPRPRRRPRQCSPAPATAIGGAGARSGGRNRCSSRRQRHAHETHTDLT